MSLLILGAQGVMAYEQGGRDIKAAVGKFGSYYSGLDFNTGQFNLGSLAIGYGPWVVKRFASSFARIRAPHGLPVSLS